MLRQTSTGWLKTLLDRHGLSAPDGRALFKYRVTTQEFNELRSLFTNRFPQTPHDHAAFSLYAAEWWRRNGKGFRWEGLLESLGLDERYVDLYDPIEIGLKQWKRKLRIGHAATGADRSWRDFVGTLSREGGLPLQLLHGEQSSVNRFFKHLLKDRYASGGIDSMAAEAAAYFLPEAWRHRDIYDLAAQLVTRVWELRERVEHAEDPIAELDRVHPGWKDDLPVVVDSDVAGLLVQGLVKEAHEIAAGGRPALSVETTLRRTRDGWTLERSVDPPRKIRVAQINKLLGFPAKHQPRRRLRLVLESGPDPVPLAVITQWSASDPYDVELLAPAPVVLLTIKDIRIYAETRDEAFGGDIARGGEALEEVPWIFAPSSTGGGGDEWKLVAQGSARLRSDSAMVVLPSGAYVVSADAGKHSEETLAVGGTLLTVVLHRQGTLRIEHEGETFEVAVAASSDEMWSYRLEGKRLDALGATDIWRGVPSLSAESPSGLRQKREPNHLDWRPHGVGQAWRPMSPDCIGEVELRYAPGGVTQVTKRAKIVPRQTDLELVPRDGVDEGGLRIVGTNAERANVVSDDGFSAQQDTYPEGFEWTFQTLAEGPPTVEIDLAWTDGRRLRLVAPYPVAGVRFIDHEGRPLGSKATISFANLSRSRVEAILPASDPDPLVTLCLANARDRTPRFVNDSETSRRLRPRTRSNHPLLKRYSLDLHEVVEDVRLRIASSAEMNAHVQLVIESPSAGSAILHVRRFSISMRINEERDAVIILRDKSESHIDDEVGRMQVRHVPISAPHAPPTVLSRRAPQEWTLDIESDDHATRLVAGYDGLVCCARPVIWAPRLADPGAVHEPTTDASTIEDAVNIPGAEARADALLALVRRMSDDPLHPEWGHVLPFVQTLGTLPATTFDLLDTMVQVPTSCVFALLAGQPKLDFQTLWAGLEDLSFSWDAVPTRDWIRGTRIWWEHTTQGFGQLSQDVAALSREALLHTCRDSADQIARRMPAFPLIRELIEHRVFGITAAGNSMTMMLGTEQGRAYFRRARDDAHQELLRAQANTEKWPVMDATRGLKKYLDTALPDYLVELEQLSGRINKWQLSVVIAPVLAALAAAWGVPLRAEQIFAIRQLRAFDVNWFQSCHRFTLACAVGLVLEKDPEHYS